MNCLSSSNNNSTNQINNVETNSLFWLYTFATIVTFASTIRVTLPTHFSVIVEYAPLLLILLFVVSFIWMNIYPGLHISRQKLVLLSSLNLKSLEERISSLESQLGIEKHINYLWSPVDTGITAYAFGSFRKQYISISGGLLKLFLHGDRSFDAVLLHEMAHIANNDVGKTYFVIHLFRMSVAAMLIPITIITLYVSACYPEVSASKIELFLTTLFMTACLEILRNQILKVREFHADYRASEVSKSIKPYLIALLEKEEVTPQRFDFIFRKHPLPQQRTRAIHSPATLSRPNKITLFISGLTITIAFKQAPIVAGFETDAFSILWYVFCIASLGVLTGTILSKSISNYVMLANSDSQIKQYSFLPMFLSFSFGAIIADHLPTVLHSSTIFSHPLHYLLFASFKLISLGIIFIWCGSYFSVTASEKLSNRWKICSIPIGVLISATLMQLSFLDPNWNAISKMSIENYASFVADASVDSIAVALTDIGFLTVLAVLSVVPLFELIGNNNDKRSRFCQKWCSEHFRRPLFLA